MRINGTFDFTQGDRSWAYAAFILGLSLTTNVAYVFKIGNTPVYVGYVVAVLLAIPLFLRDLKSGGPHLGMFDKSLWAFTLVCFLSLFPSIAAAAMGFAPGDTPLTVLKGLIVFVCGILIYYVVVSLETHIRYLVIGLALGIIINGIFCVAQQVAFESGSYFSLYSLFPQDSFAVSAKWEIWSSLPLGAGHINVFRPQGLFLETSHLMVFLVCFVPFVFLDLQNSAAKAAVSVCALYACLTSMSPNSIFLIIEVLILTALHFSGGLTKLRLSDVRFNPFVILFALAVLLVSLFALFSKPELLSGAFDSLGRSLTDLNITSTTDDGTLERWDSMVKALSAISYFPFGSGWNTESQVLTFIYGSSDVASHSFAIRLLLETGIIGLLSYVYLIIRHSLRLVLTESPRTISIGIGALFMLLCQFTNGTSMVPWVWALLGLAQSEILRIGRSDRE